MSRYSYRPNSLFFRLQRWRENARQQRALADIYAKPHDHWLEDAGLTRERAQHLLTGG